MHDTNSVPKQVLSMLALVASAAVAPLGESAAPDTSEWKCERCPFASGHEGDIAAGGTWVSDDAATVGDATGYDRRGGYLNVDGSGLLATGAHRLAWRLEDLGIDSRAVGLQGTRGGTIDYHLDYREIPRHRYDTTRTIFSRSEDGQLILPATWTYSGTTAGFADLAASLAPEDIESERRELALGARYRPVGRFRLFADLQRQERDGTRVVGGSFFTNSSLLPHRFDHRTDRVDAGARYDGARGHLELAYHGSFFADGLRALRWENPFVSLPGAEQGALAEAPDNDFQQLALTGSIRLGLFDSRVAFSAALGRGTQDETLLPYASNPNLATAPLPAATADARVDATNLALTVVSRPLPRLRVNFSLRRDERDNETPRRPWSRVIADSFLSGESEFNVPYSFERLRTNLSGEYELSDALRISAGYDYLEYDREFQEVAEQTEDTGWGRVRWRPNAHVDVSARGGISRRDAQFYDVAVAALLDQNPLLRKFNLAYRYRRFADLSISTSPFDWPLTLHAQAAYADDSYSSTSLGLTATEEWRVSMDIGWTISEKAYVYVTAGLDETDVEQAGSKAFAAPDWQADQSDRFHSLGGGLRVTAIGDKVDLQLDYARGRGITEIAVAGGDGPAAFPDLRSTLDSLRLSLRYHWSEVLEAGLLLRYERLPAEDWALEGVAPDTLPTILTLGAEPYDDEVWMAGIGIRYRLGGK